MSATAIVKVTGENCLEWARLCCELWPDASPEEMLDGFLSGQNDYEYLYKSEDCYVAFIGLSVRKEYVEGKEGTAPVGYIEGIYVKPEYRGKGIARELAEFAKVWCVKNGLTMLASDCLIENSASRSFHNSIGFEEANVNVHFIMKI